jgi:hypothetical protein
MKLLDPIAMIASDEVNLPAWHNTIELIYPSVVKLCTKPKPPIVIKLFLN